MFTVTLEMRSWMTVNSNLGESITVTTMKMLESFADRVRAETKRMHTYILLTFQFNIMMAAKMSCFAFL